MLAIATLMLAPPAVAPAKSVDCALRMECAGWFCKERKAEAVIDEEPDGWTLRMTGTHISPDGLDRRVAEPVTVKATRSDAWGEQSFAFADRQTAGLLSYDYGGLAALSLHIVGSDRAYFEHFTGFCEVQD